MIRRRPPTRPGTKAVASAATKAAGKRRRTPPRVAPKLPTTRQRLLAAAGRITRRLVVPVVFVVALGAVMLAGVFPTRTYLSQRGQIVDSERRLSELEARNAEMRSRLERLSSDEEIERVAREQYGYVKEGEEVYHILPEPEPPVVVPDVWPFDGMRERLGAASSTSATATTSTTTGTGMAGSTAR
jgi:cell division protein FtsB